MMPPKAIVMQRPARKKCEAVLQANGRVLAFRCRSQASFQEKLRQFVCKQTTKWPLPLARPTVGDLATGSCAEKEKERGRHCRSRSFLRFMTAAIAADFN